MGTKGNYAAIRWRRFKDRFFDFTNQQIIWGAAIMLTTSVLIAIGIYQSTDGAFLSTLIANSEIKGIVYAFCALIVICLVMALWTYFFTVPKLLYRDQLKKFDDFERVVNEERGNFGKHLVELVKQLDAFRYPVPTDDFGEIVTYVHREKEIGQTKTEEQIFDEIITLAGLGVLSLWGVEPGSTYPKAIEGKFLSSAYGAPFVDKGFHLHCPGNGEVSEKDFYFVKASKLQIDSHFSPKRPVRNK